MFTALARLASLAVLLASPLGAQTNVRNTADIPQGAPGNESASENVDFGDLDVDGDFDAVFANGGDFTPDQNRIWNNLGGAQGMREGTFADETAARAPVVNDQSRDVDLADLDGDFDLDLLHGSRDRAPRMFRSRLAENGGQPSFRDVTAAVFPPDHVTGEGHFEQELGDLDDDGDLDVFVANFSGQDMLLRNDSAGAGILCSNVTNIDMPPPVRQTRTARPATSTGTATRICSRRTTTARTSTTRT